MSKAKRNPRPNPRRNPCPVARAAGVIGMRWTAEILRDLLLLGPRRYRDFLDSLKGVSPNTLSERLKLLEAAGVVERRFYQQHPPRAEYLLTKKGRALRPVLKAMYDWGEKHT